MINTEREKIINELKNLETFVGALNEKYELEMDDLIDKIKKAISNLEKSKFMVAVFGAFSDGKSTILSAITKNFNIEISPEPTTDKIVEYPYGEFIFIDTPGIFSDNLMHDEKTRKFISEANVIIFVCDAVNPIKQSHIPVLKWLFKELGKLDVTIFVINKMDLVVSLKDDTEFSKMSEIKKNALLESLKEIMGIKIEVPIICIAANPYDLGLDSWKNNWIEYEKLSRIGELIGRINHIYEKYKEQLIAKAGISVIRETLITSLEKLKKAKEITDERFKINKNLTDELELKIKALKNNVSVAYEQYKQELINLREDIILKIESTNKIDDLRKIAEVELGKDGEILKSKIELCINRALSPLNENIISFDREFDFAVNDSWKIYQEIASTVSASLVKISDKVLQFNTQGLMRELFRIRREYGLDKIIKFQGRGEHMKWASRWAGRLQKFATIGKVLGPVLEVVFFLKEMFDIKKFNKKKNEIIETIHSIFKELLEINYNEFVDTFAPEVREYEKNISNLRNLIENDRLMIDEMGKNLLKIENAISKFKYLPR